MFGVKLLQEKYIYKCNLPLLKKKGDKFNFRCVFCGDSKKKKTKKRGWLLWNSSFNTYVYYCFNCGMNTNFNVFLKKYDSNLYSSYKKDYINEFINVKYNKKKNIEKNKKTIKEEKYYISFLQNKLQYAIYNNKAKEFLLKRKIPEKYFSLFFYSQNFSKFINKYFEKNKFKEVEKDERIVIPYLEKNGKLLQIEGRSLNNNKIRYLHYKFSDPVIFNLQNIDYNKIIYVVEGVFDSLFLDNCVAVSGISKMYNIDEKLNLSVDKFILIPDNEYYKKEINKQIKKFIKKGFKIGFFENVKHKDINEMVINNVDIYKHLKILEGKDAEIFLKLQELK